MVFKKRLEYGSNCFNVPIIPRAPRSRRLYQRKGLNKRTIEDHQICAFELLASLAGKLLQETEISSASSNTSEGDRLLIGNEVIKEEPQLEDREMKPDQNAQGSCEASLAIVDSVIVNSGEKCLLNEFPDIETDNLECTFMSSCCSKKADGELNSVGCEIKHSCKSPSDQVSSVHSNGEVYDDIVENKFKQEHETVGSENEGLTMCSKFHTKDPTELSMVFPAVVVSSRDVKLASCRDHFPSAFARHKNNIKLGCRDDDENFSRYYKFSNKIRAHRPPARIRDRRIRKLLSSKYWKVAPKLKDIDLPSAVKSLYWKRKMCNSRERYQHDMPYKNRKKMRISDRTSIVRSDGGFGSGSVSNHPGKGMSRENDSHVKFSIKSFRVPELLIELPESATVGSLKKTIMETMTSLLGGGMHVGVLVQGNKIRDDNRTLAQTGISSQENLDSLGFILEQNNTTIAPPVCDEDSPLLLPCSATTLSTSSAANPVSDEGILNLLLHSHLPVTNSGNHVESSHELVSSDTKTLTNRTLLDSKALIPVPPISVEALAIVPVNQKIRRSEFAHRRTRRPFSVSEVEALVHAVEEVGTGRWRDVKLRAFEDADHRTYVDLKDKWKTLVHTAKISPQQRRGEPVPQELLDRVLAAHGYWSENQAKQQGKLQTGSSKITETESNGN